MNDPRHRAAPRERVGPHRQHQPPLAFGVETVLQRLRDPRLLDQALRQLGQPDPQLADPPARPRQPFTLIFAAVTALMGDYPRAAALLWRSYLSALWVSLLMATTPLEVVLETAARFGVPRLLVEVTHFTWRYLGVIGAQAWRLKTVALTRGGERSFHISVASLAVLFASSYARAERIHRAMLSRGATGENA